MITQILRPVTARDAVRAKRVPGAAYLGGGTSLCGAAAGAAGVTTLISLENLGLDRVVAAGDGVEIGAAVTLQRLVDAPTAPRALRDAALLTASRTIRNMATVGGELGLDPADSAIIPVLIVMGASVRLAEKRRPVALEEWLNGRRAGLVLSVIVPGTARPAAVLAVSRTSHSPRSLVAAACRDGQQLRMLLCDCAGTRARLLQEAAPGADLPSGDRLHDLVARVFAPKADMHASAEYKRYRAGVLAADLVRALGQGASS